MASRCKAIPALSRRGALFLADASAIPEEWEQQYRECLYYADFRQALEFLERIGDMHSAHADELQFWKELYFAAQHMELDQHAARYEARLQQVLKGPRL